MNARQGPRFPSSQSASGNTAETVSGSPNSRPDSNNDDTRKRSVSSPHDILAAAAAAAQEHQRQMQAVQQRQSQGLPTPAFHPAAAAAAMDPHQLDDSALAAAAAAACKRTKEQEKNRRAQARFRERQKMKQSETEKRLQELEAAVNALQMERDALAIKAETLERCLLKGEQPGDAVGDRTEAQNGTTSDISFRDYVQWYKGYVQQLAPLLVQAQFDVNSEAGKKISNIWHLLVKQAIKFHHADAIRQKVYSCPILLEDEPQPPRPDKALWQQVTDALRLTPEQLRHCHEVRTNYKSAMANIMTQRQALNATMQDMPECDANAKVALHTAKAQEALQHLQANLKQEQVLQNELSIEVFERVLTPVQAATAFVGLYPWAPDKLAILNCACSTPLPEST